MTSGQGCGTLGGRYGEESEMRMSDRAKLEAEGCWFNPSSQYNKTLARHTDGFRVNNKGWYHGRTFIGDNYKEAIKWLKANGR